MTPPRIDVLLSPPALMAGVAAGVGLVAASAVSLVLSRGGASGGLASRLSWHGLAVRLTRNRRAREWLRQWDERMAPKLEEAGWTRLSPLLYLTLLTAGAVAGALFGGAVLNNTVAAACLGALAVLVPEELLVRAISIKRARLARQLPATVQILHAEISDGTSIAQALQATAARVPWPMGGILQRTVRRLQAGRHPDEVFGQLAETLPTEYGRLFAQLLRAAYDDVGAVRLLPKLAARAVNQHVQVQKARSMVAFHSAVGFILNILFVPCFLVIQWLVPETFSYLTGTPLGRVAVAVASVSLLVGVLLQRGLRAGVGT